MTGRFPGLMFVSMRSISSVLALIVGLIGAIATAQSPVAESEAAIATEHTRATLLSEHRAVAPGSSFWVALKLEIDPGWHTYWKNPGDSGLPGDIVWTLPPGVSAGPIEWPVPERTPYGPLMNFGYHDKVVLPVKMTVAADAPPIENARLEADANWLVCADVCIPDQGSMALPLTIAANAPVASTPAAVEIAAAVAAIPAPAPWPVSVSRSGESWRVAVKGDWREAPASVEFFPDVGGVIDNASVQSVSFDRGEIALTVKADPTTKTPFERIDGLLAVASTPGAPRTGFTFSSPVTAAPLLESAPFNAPADIGLLTALIFAFLGGLILNLMPCVLPVLAMKAVAMTRAGGTAARRDGIAYTFGAMATFAALAGVLLAVRGGGSALGWGFQLQEPGFVAAMAAIVLALGLMLSGVFTVGGSVMGVGQGLTARGDWLGSFFTGALAVVVATPCTAPFMGSAMAFAMTQPAIASFAVFEALALGLAAPFLVISLVPAAAGMIPKPGPWMDTFKQILAFPMYATAAWLLWVLTQQTGPDGVAAALAALTLVGLAAWGFGHVQRGGARAVGAAVAAVAAIASLGLLTQVASAPRMTATAADPAGALASEPFSEQRLAALRAEGRPVFINFTAAWCITCLVNERVAFSNADVIEAMTSRKVVYLKADWTNYDPTIGKVLASYGRVGVPLYLYFAPNAAKPEILPQILTPGALMAAIGGGVATR